jgi:hypothetical protein
MFSHSSEVMEFQKDARLCFYWAWQQTTVIRAAPEIEAGVSQIALSMKLKL